MLFCLHSIFSLFSLLSKETNLSMFLGTLSFKSSDKCPSPLYKHPLPTGNVFNGENTVSVYTNVIYSTIPFSIAVYNIYTYHLSWSLLLVVPWNSIFQQNTNNKLQRFTNIPAKMHFKCHISLFLMQLINIMINDT